MPTYEYHCEKCDRTFEVFQSMKDDHLTTCQDEACKGKVRRLIGTGAGLLFKGSGFYITDYRSSNYKEAAKKDASSGSASSASSASSTGPTGGSASSGSTPPKPAAPKP